MRINTKALSTISMMLYQYYWRNLGWLTHSTNVCWESITCRPAGDALDLTWVTGPCISGTNHVFQPGEQHRFSCLTFL